MANSSNLAFCLEYSNHKTDMMDAFDDYLRNESMVDVMLSCEGNTIKAHKMVLSAGSTYFRNIFAAFKNPFQFPVLIIKDMPFRDLKAIVEFLYRGEVVVPVEQVSSLSKSAQTLFIKGLEKYFNKSAMVNVANHSNNSSGNHSTKQNTEDNSMRRTQNKSLNSSKSRAKQSVNQSNRSIGMSLRNTRRPDYRQLSNGDFNSDEEMSEIDLQTNEFTLIDNQKQTNLRYSGLLSRQIKSEIINGNSRNTQNENIENSEKDDSVVLNQDDYQSEDVFEATETAQNHYSDDGSEIESEDEHRIASTSKDCTQMGPLKKDGINSTQMRKINSSLNKPNEKRKGISIKSSSNQRSSTNSRPIKGDPDKMELIHCSLCPRVFSQSTSLTIHMKRIHSENKEHICQICGKKYSWRSGLYKHMRMHRN